MGSTGNCRLRQKPVVNDNNSVFLGESQKENPVSAAISGERVASREHENQILENAHNTDKRTMRIFSTTTTFPKGKRESQSNPIQSNPTCVRHDVDIPDIRDDNGLGSGV